MCVKNCGHGFHVEVAARTFIDPLIAMVRFNVRDSEKEQLVCQTELDSTRSSVW